MSYFAAPTLFFSFTLFLTPFSLSLYLSLSLLLSLSFSLVLVSQSAQMRPSVSQEKSTQACCYGNLCPANRSCTIHVGDLFFPLPLHPQPCPVHHHPFTPVTHPPTEGGIGRSPIARPVPPHPALARFPFPGVQSPHSTQFRAPFSWRLKASCRFNNCQHEPMTVLQGGEEEGECRPVYDSNRKKGNLMKMTPLEK